MQFYVEIRLVAITLVVSVKQTEAQLNLYYAVCSVVTRLVQQTNQQKVQIYGWNVVYCEFLKIQHFND